MKLPIYAYGHPILRKKTDLINKDYPNLKELIADMYDTMYHAHGMGLAAPQIGKNIRLFVVDTEQLNKDEDSKGEQGIKRTFINPYIVEEAGNEWLYEEGCLSIPDIRGKVSRPPQVRIRYLDENFKEHDEVFDRLTARVIQHEYDHIEGVLFIDKLSVLKRQLLKKRLEKIEKGQIFAGYKMVFP